MLLFPATDTCLCQKLGNFCVTRSRQPACLTGTGTQGFLHRRNKTNERDHQKLSSLVGSQHNGREARRINELQAIWMPQMSHFSSVFFQTERILPFTKCQSVIKKNPEACAARQTCINPISLTLILLICWDSEDFFWET